MTKMWRRRMGGLILCSMACTTVMLAVQGRMREAIPLHLCSVSALAAAVLAFIARSDRLLDYLWHARHAGRNSGARVSRTRRPAVMADALHGLLHRSRTR